MPNASLDQNLQNQGMDPFAQARQQQADRAALQPDSAVVENPFAGGISPGHPQQPTMGSQLPPSGDHASQFQTLVKQFGLDPSGLSEDPSLSRMQLTKRLQEKYGPDFASVTGVPDLLKAHDDMQAANPYKMDQAKSTAKLKSQAERTLKALMGAP